MKLARSARCLAASLAIVLLSGGTALASTACGNDGRGFENWKSAFIREASARGVSSRALDALSRTSYATKTIAADRGQKSFKLSLQEFMKRRGSDAIVSRGKSMKSRYAGLLASIESQYGVPPGPLLAIWGMETGFGGFLGNQNILSAVATLAYDCRRSEFFTGHLYAALQLVERGMLSPSAVGAAHGEIGQTQFLPGNALKYGVDGDGDGRIDMIGSVADALTSTANFLRAHGWRPGAGYQPGEPNFAAIQSWNAASVYQQAIAIMGRQIDGS
ncbi:lytic murein transglycosylase [Chelativorans sp. Marseille-P2723]|uniref:lytic murein transglycosylase n=1 Tax=Chelativorans sp. Marseille-P2723 TaxID=2709133 RepID=UPI00156FA5E6|nr:lytic murein transglycosylase [Chelativorans sp. Marseille-P2723]